MKDWEQLSQVEQKEALLNLKRRDIGDGPTQWAETFLIGRLIRSGLLEDKQIRKHFEGQGIPLPPVVNK
jgi:hypothetical protein